MQTLMRYVEEKPYDAMAHLVLGYNLKFSGKSKDAEKAFQRVLEIDPKSTAAQLFLTASATLPAKEGAEAAPAAPVEKPAEATPADPRR
jgi:tetratricopeptide (TPR) repeat protein